jgi:hypothetical protein
MDERDLGDRNREQSGFYQGLGRGKKSHHSIGIKF